MANTKKCTLSKSVFELMEAMETLENINYADELKAVLRIIQKK